MNLTLLNNRFVTTKDAKVPISSGLLRGYGIFETLRTYNGEIFQAKAHTKRLLQSCKKIELETKYNSTQILRMLDKVAKKSPHKNQRIKATVLEGTLIITSSPIKKNPKAALGVKCKSIVQIRSLPNIKSISYLDSYLANTAAQKAGYFEAILTNEKEEVFEGAYSNIFWFEKDQLCTRKDHILEGITRKTVIKLNKNKVTYKTVTLKQLQQKKEVFLTSSIKGIVPITKIDKRKIGTGKPGPHTQTLMQKFSSYVSS